MSFTAQCVLALSVQPSLPEDVEPKEPSYLEDPRDGRFIIPEGIRPVLKEFRIEVSCLLQGWLLHQMAQPAHGQGRAWGGSWVWGSNLPSRPEQMPGMEVLDIQEKPPQWFNNQSCCVCACSMSLGPCGHLGRVVSCLSWGLC